MEVLPIGAFLAGDVPYQNLCRACQVAFADGSAISTCFAHRFPHVVRIPAVVLKLGPEGALVATGDGRWRVKGIAVETVDTTGAGDTFDGAFLSMLVLGEGPLEAARYANAAAALSTCGYGAVAPIPRRAEVLQFLGEEVHQ